MTYKIAIDVGGTHTDAVLISMDSESQTEIIVDSLKIPTHGTDVSGSVLDVMGQLLRNNTVRAENVSLIQLGTTHFVNALKQRQHLQKVAAIRLALPASDFVPPFASWPRKSEEGQRSLYEETLGYAAIIHGGNECNGDVSAKLSRRELETVAQEIMARGLKKVLISAPFSEKFPAMEKIAQAELKRLLPRDVEIQRSQDIGRGNILQRENAAILNLSLRQVSSEIFTDLQQRLAAENYQARLLITRNDGSSMPVKEALKKPFLAYSSGQINSIRGAGMLSDIKDAVVVDVGGTTTDVGLLENGVPHMVNLTSKEEDIDLMLTCAHQSSIALGGGSIIKFGPEGRVNVSEQSVGHELETEAFFAGGNTFTVTDLAIAQGRLHFDRVDMVAFRGALRLAGISRDQLITADKIVHQKAAKAIDGIRINNNPLPVLLVGGGAPLLDGEQLRQHLVMPYEKISVPERAGVANAIGASAGKVMAIHSVECLENDERAKEAAKRIAIEKAVAQGAKAESVICVSEYSREISYDMSGNVNFTVVVEGDLGLVDLDANDAVDFFDEVAVSTEEYVQDDAYERAIVTSQAQDSLSIESNDASVHILTPEEIQQMAVGTGYLGSGGGGDAAIGDVALRSAQRSGFPVSLVDLNDLDNNDYVIMVGYGGMPSVINERLLSSLSGPAAMMKLKEMLEDKLSREAGSEQHANIVAAIPIEVGGANGLLSALQASSWGIPIADADAMGRAFPMINMNTVDIYGHFDEQMIALANDQGKVVTITGESLDSCLPQIGAAIGENGGAVFAALMPMRVEEAKRYCLLNTLSDAIKIGKAVKEGLQSKAPIQTVLSRALDETIYGECETVFSGTVIKYSPKSDGQHNSGSITIRNLDGQLCDIYFKNECLLATVDAKPVALSPDIISLVNPDTGIAIGSTADYHVGLRINVIKIEAPERLKTPEALAVLRDELIQGLIQQFDLGALLSDANDETDTTESERQPMRLLSNTNFGGRSTLYHPRGTATTPEVASIERDNEADILLPSPPG